jgi:hypothetical protein
LNGADNGSLFIPPGAHIFGALCSDSILPKTGLGGFSLFMATFLSVLKV